MGLRLALNNIKDYPSMRVSGKNRYKHQAGNQDYENSIPNKGVNRGHLFPSQHAPDDDTRKSTFTLTNIVPQAETFNGGSWSRMECAVRHILQNQCVDNNNNINSYVVTGALPSQKNKLNKRVNIPSVMWTAFCCYNRQSNKWIAQAHWGDNKDNSTGNLPNKTLRELYQMLKSFYLADVQVFPDECPINYIFLLQGREGNVLEECVYDENCVCNPDPISPTKPNPMKHIEM